MSRTTRAIETIGKGNKGFKKTANKKFRSETKNNIANGNFDNLDNSNKNYSTLERTYKKKVANFS